MQEETSSNRSKAELLFYGAMVLVGVYAVLRFGAEGAYQLGRLVGSS